MIGQAARSQGHGRPCAAAAVVSAWGARKCSSIAAAFTYSYTPERQMQDRARIAPLIAHLAQHPAESDAAEAGITATP